MCDLFLFTTQLNAFARFLFLQVDRHSAGLCSEASGVRLSFIWSGPDS